MIMELSGRTCNRVYSVELALVSKGEAKCDLGQTCTSNCARKDAGAYKEQPLWQESLLLGEI